MVALIGLLGILGNGLVSAFFYGKLVERVQNHEQRIEVLEEIHPRKGETRV